MSLAYNKLIGYNDEFNLLTSLYKKNNFPNKLIFKGKKGIGKCTFAYHLINFIFSKNENFPYDIEKRAININNYSHKLVDNNVHPNFYLIEIKENKKTIDISQIREMLNFSNKTSMSDSEKIVLIDNAEFLNLNSANSLLKILEEPNENLFFILIHNSKDNIFETIKSRCLTFNLNLNYSNKNKIINLITNNKVNLNDLNNYYSTPGEVINLYNFCEENKIILDDIKIEILLKKIKENKMLINYLYVNENISNLLEIYIHKKFLNSTFNIKHYNLYSSFLNKIKYFKTYNLDIESLLIEFNSTFVNG